jgi:hypothetical protein
MTASFPGRRGQLVLLAAATLAVALVPMALAYLQLGYHGDVGAAGVDEAPLGGAERVLDRSLHGAVEGIPSEHAWSNHSSAVTAVHDRLRDDVATLNRSAVASGTVYAVTYNASRAAAWAGEHCPGGPDRQFGACEADRGVVVQPRADRTHVLAVAFDLRATTPDGRWEATTLVRVGR